MHLGSAFVKRRGGSTPLFRPWGPAGWPSPLFVGDEALEILPWAAGEGWICSGRVRLGIGRSPTHRTGSDWWSAMGVAYLRLYKGSGWRRLVML